MFRVLSEEESRRVTRWQAPDLSNNGGSVANTRQHARPLQPEKDASVRALLGSQELAPGRQQRQSPAPRLDSISSINVLDVMASHASVQPHGPKFTASDAEQGNLPAVSAELLQSSYEEGYSKGYAEGSIALHQYAVTELRAIIAALSAATERCEDADLEHEVLALSMDIARLVIRREISVDKQIMRDIVDAGLEQLPSATSAARCVYLHPLDANVVREQLVDDTTVQILDDPLLDRGACRIESGASVVNAGVEDWLHTVSEQLGLTPEYAGSTTDGLAANE